MFIYNTKKNKDYKKLKIEKNLKLSKGVCSEIKWIFFFFCQKSKNINKRITFLRSHKIIETSHRKSYYIFKGTGVINYITVRPTSNPMKKKKCLRMNSIIRNQHFLIPLLKYQIKL